jgi:hypothetical protein
MYSSKEFGALQHIPAKLDVSGSETVANHQHVHGVSMCVCNIAGAGQACGPA